MRKNYKLTLRAVLFLCLGFIFSNYQAQQTYTFTTAGASGQTGPNQTQVTNTYSNTNLAGQVTATAGYQYWVVPNGITNIRIETYGAQGGLSGNNAGGFGACMRGDFTVTAGATLKILVGQQGVAGSNQGGGGGGTYVTLLNNSPLCIAGGGGGGYYSSYSGLAGTMSGTVSTSGNAGVYGYNSAYYGAGGTNGNGGSAGTSFSTPQGGAGGGLLSNGANGTSSGAYGGTAFVNGGQGGASVGSPAGSGGFGGGGGADWSSYTGAGGGGGYSGGGSATYYGCGGGGGSYNSGSNQNNASGCNSGNGKVIITELCSITLSVNGISSNSTICTGNTLTLTTNGVSNYSWSTGSTASSIVVTPNSTSVYSLTALSPSNCTSSSIVTITVHQSVPVLTVVNTASASGGICPGKSVTLTATGATTYTWAGAQNVTNGATFNPTITSGYTVTGTNACGTGSASTSLSIHPVPTVGAAISQPTICSGQTFTPTGFGNAQGYSWSHNLQNGASNVAGVSSVYTVTGTSALTCTNTATVSLQVVQTPILAPVLSTVSICFGGQATITASGATNYTWLPMNSNASSVVVNPGTTQSYTLIKSNANCVDTKTVSLLVNQLPIIFAVTSDGTVCASKPATLTAGGGLTYTWAPTGGTQYTAVVAPPVTTIYTVTSSDGKCISSNTVEVYTNPNPVITVAASATNICFGESVTINVSGANTYTWSDPQLSGTAVTVTPAISTVYNISGTNGFTCTSGVSQVVVVNQLPVLTAVRNRTLVCSGYPSTLTATGAHTYTWTNTGATVPVTTVNPVSTTVYTVTGTFTNTQCKNTKTVEVAVFMPTFATSNNTAICAGGSILLTSSGGVNGSFVWYSPGAPPMTQPNIMVTPTAATIYTVTANVNSIPAYVTCPAVKTVSVGIYTNPTITAVAQRTLICRRETVTLTGGGGNTYVWSHGASGTTVEVAPVAETKYTVTGTDVYNCVSTATVLVRVSTCPGFEENQIGLTGLSVYPNPNNGTFVIKTEVALELQLRNPLGQVIDTFTVDANTSYQADAKHLANGMYFVTGVYQGQKITQKIMISK